MTDELIFTVDQATARPAQRITLASVGLLERRHLQEWVLAYPEILGVEAKIVTFEFARWASIGGEAPADRLDVLAVDRSGRLIVAELKRDKAPDTVTMQAINYAAMVSRFSLDTLAEVYATHLGGDVTAADARVQLEEWAGDISDETLSPPRIVLLASDFGPTVTNTALFLYEAGIDLHLRRYQLYQTAAGERVLSVSQLLPVPEADQFMVKPKSSVATQAESRSRRERRATVAARLIAAGAVATGDRLTIVVPGRTQEDQQAIRIWLAGDPKRAAVTWVADAQYPVRWDHDGQNYNLTTLIRRIITAATQESPRTDVWGPAWYHAATGPLWKIAEQLDDPPTTGPTV